MGDECVVCVARVWLDSGLVFVTVIGTAIDPMNFTHAFQALCSRAGVRRVRLHDLRHTCVSLLLAWSWRSWATPPWR